MRVEKYDLRVQTLPDTLEHLRQAVERGAFPHIHDDGGAIHISRLAHERREIGHQLQGQIVDAMKSQILECLER